MGLVPPPICLCPSCTTQRTRVICVLYPVVGCYRDSFCGPTYTSVRWFQYTFEYFLFQEKQCYCVFYGLILLWKIRARKKFGHEWGLSPPCWQGAATPMRSRPVRSLLKVGFIYLNYSLFLLKGILAYLFGKIRSVVKPRSTTIKSYSGDLLSPVFVAQSVSAFDC